MSPAKKAIEQLTQQGRLARYLSLVLADCRIDHTGRCQRNDDHEAGDGKADARFLGGVLRVLPLVLGSVGHLERRSIDQLGMSSLEEMPCVDLPLTIRSDVGGQFVERCFRKFGQRPAVVASVRIDTGSTDQLQMTADATDGGLAGCFLAVAEHLAHESPKNDRRGVSAPEQPAVPCKELPDSLFG